MRRNQTVTEFHPVVRRIFLLLTPVVGLIVLLVQLGFLMPVALAHTHANGTPSFTIDGNFKANAEQSVQQTESTYVQSHADCANWISYFLETYYNMRTNLGSENTDALINNLIGDNDATVITGDQQYDAGAFIPASQAENIVSGLDTSMIENGGSEEFIFAYQWSNRSSTDYADHVAIYVGNGQVVSHGMDDGHGNWGYDRSPRVWTFGPGIVGNLAIIALTNSSATSTGSSTTSSNLPTNEAGHVLSISQTTAIVDANGNPLSPRCNGPSDGNGNAELPANWDVVADANTTVSPQGTPLLEVMYPDPCEPGLDFSSNQDIADGNGAVGYVAWSALSETDAIQPNPPFSSGADWRDCWDPTQCTDQPYPNNSDTLSAKDQPYLFAWWNGQAWDPHWWHAVDNQGNDCAVYARDWSALVVYG
jgi:hypothetical protein